MRNALMAVGVAAGLFTMASTAVAEDRFSLRAGVGLAEPAGGDFEDDVGFSVGAGWNFLPWLSAEVGYNDFGTFRSKEEFDGGTVRVSGDSLEFGLVAQGEFGGSGVFGQVRLGGHKWDMQASDADFEVEDDGTDLYYGAGVGYRFDSGLGLVLGYDRYEVGDGDIDRVSLGVEYRF